jgi:beta-ketoacyl synthase-like protein
MPVITAWSAVSPFGAGRDAYMAGIRSGRPTAGRLDPDTWQVPDKEACLIPEYDPRTLVGGKVAGYLNRSTVLALAVVGHLVDDTPGDRTGLVLGTTGGSMQSTMKIARDTFVNERPFHVDPKTLPGGVMNCAATQCAIRYKLTGPNTTIAGGPGAGLFALAYANRLLATGRADSVLVGAVEEYSEARSWLTHHNGGGVVGEGGVVFRVEPGRDQAIAEILAVDSKVCLDHDVEPVLRASMKSLLDKGNVRAEDVWDVVAATDPAPQIGDTGAASAAFAIASALSVPGPAGRLVVITSSEPGGSVTSVLLRLMGGDD